MSSRENLTLELKIICATNVMHTNAMDKIDVYAVVSIIGDNYETQAVKTPIDYDGGSNPTWNHLVKFSISKKEAQESRLMVNIKLYNYELERAVDLEMGEVNVSVEELFATDGNGDKMKLMNKFLGETETKVSLSYRFKRELAGNMYPSLSDYSSSFRYLDRDSYEPVVNVNPPNTNLILELVVKMAKGIKDSSWIYGMDLYASVTVREGTIITNRSNTPVVFGVHETPRWDHAIKFTLKEPLARNGRLSLFVQLIDRRTMRGDKEIGKLEVPILELLGCNPPSTDMKLVTRDIIGPSGKIGSLTFMYRFLSELTMNPPNPSQHPTPPTPPQHISPPAPPTAIPQPFIMVFMPAPPTI